MGPDPATLEAMPLFAGLDGAQLDRIAGWFEQREISPGGQLTSEGASGYQFFVVEAGQADVLVDGRRVGELGPGDFFGEVALLGEAGRRMAAVVAATPMRVAAMFGTEFRRLEAEAPEVIERLRAAMQERLRIAGLL
jgi:CRP-like cAMP-binding protein